MLYVAEYLPNFEDYARLSFRGVPIAWHSNHSKRVVVSFCAGESQVGVIGFDASLWLSQCLVSAQGRSIDPRVHWAYDKGEF